MRRGDDDARISTPRELFFGSDRTAYIREIGWKKMASMFKHLFVSDKSTGIPSSTFITIPMIGYDIYLSTMSKTLVSFIYFRLNEKKHRTQFFF